MRCEQVIRELAAPSDDRDAAALARHLAECPACADRSRAFARLDALWEATRPAEPDADAWGAVWTNVAAALPAAPARAASETIVAFAPAPRKARARAALVWMARAAAVLLAFGLAWRVGRVPRAPENPRGLAQHAVAAPETAAQQGPTPVQLGAPVLVEADIEEGHLMLIRADGPAPEVVDMAPPESAYSVDDMYVMFNLVESIANPVVAAR